LISKIFISIIKIYQITLSPFLGKQCRFTPTCSKYAEESFQKHGSIKGVFLSLKRIFRCNPWGDSGYDPVPD